MAMAIKSASNSAVALAAGLGLLLGVLIAGMAGFLTPFAAAPALLILLGCALAGAAAVVVFGLIVERGRVGRLRERAAQRRALLDQELDRARQQLAAGTADPEALNARLGTLLLLRDEPGEALRYLKLADHDEQQSGLLYNNAGVALALQGRHEKAAKALRAAARRLEDDPAVELNRCLAALRADDLKSALRHLRAAGEAADGGAWRQVRALLETRRENPERAVGILQELRDETDGDDPLQINALGVALAERGSLDEAERTFEQALTVDSRLAAAQANLGLVALLNGRYRQALANLRRAVSLDPALELAHSNLGIVHHLLGDFDDSKNAWRTALQLNGGLVAAHHNLSQAYLEQRRHEEALLAAEQALRHRPEETASRINYGCALFHLRRLDEAAEQFELCAEQTPKSALAHHDLGLAYAVSGRLDPAIAAFQKAAELEPQEPSHRQAIAYTYHINGLQREAHRAYEELLSDGKTAELCYHAGLCDYALGRHEMAVNWFEEALRLRPEMTQTQFPLGCAYAACDRADLALQYWEKGLEGEPESPDLLSNLGLAYYRLGRNDESMSALRRAYFVRPDDPTFCNNLALAYARAGRFQRAADFFENTVDITPDSVVARCNLGLAYYLSGRVEEALEVWTDASKVDPNYYLRRQKSDLTNTFDDVELRAPDLDWQSRALPRLPITAGFCHRFIAQLPDLPWQVMVTEDMVSDGEQARAWQDAKFAVVPR